MMFTVKLGPNGYVCTCAVQLLNSKLLTVSDAECVVTVPLGVSSDSKAVNTLTPLFKKELAEAEKRSQGFITHMEKQSATLEKMLLNFENRPAAERTKKHYDQLVDWVKRDNDEISVLWERWCKKHAPKMASEALSACLKATRDQSVQQLADAKKTAVGKVSKLPSFQLVAGAVSIATGGVPAMVLGTLKVAAAYLDKQRDLQKVLQQFSDGHVAVARDLAEFGKAVDALAVRIESVDAHRTSLEMMIIQNTLDAQKILRDLATVKSGASGTAVKEVDALNSALAETLRSTQALSGQIVDAAPLAASLKVITDEKTKMAAHLKLSTSKSQTATKDMSPIIKMVKESGDVLKALSDYIH